MPLDIDELDRQDVRVGDSVSLLYTDGVWKAEKDVTTKPWRVHSVTPMSPKRARVFFRVPGCQMPIDLVMDVDDMKRHDVRIGDKLLLNAGPEVRRVLVEERDGTETPMIYCKEA